MSRPLTIEDQARVLLGPELGECISQRTQLGIAKYGQRLDDNDQPERAFAIHLVQELLDGIQYALKMQRPDIAARLADEAEDLRDVYALQVAEIMAGGKR